MNEMKFAVEAFLSAVRDEIERAQRKFPANGLASVALMEEVGELAKAVLDESTERVHAEAVQVACMAFRVGVEGDRSCDEHRKRHGLGRLTSAVFDLDAVVSPAIEDERGVGTGPSAAEDLGLRDALASMRAGANEDEES